MAQQTVNINGRTYDKHTGMPLDADERSRADKHHASSLHARTHRSKTLSRRYVKKSAPKPSHDKDEVVVAAPAAPKPPESTPAKQPSPSKHVIRKYAPHPKATSQGKTMNDIAPVTHPMVQTVHAARAAKSTHAPVTTKKRVAKPSDMIKAEAIEEAMSRAEPAHHRTGRHKAPKSERRASKSRRLSLAAAGMAVLVMASYLTYLNMPNLSVRVAAARAGIDAGYPSYRPSGYSLAGPVQYDDGRVAMTFDANGTDQGFVLSQERSGWDSAAVLEDYVVPKAGENYTTTRDGGLTIYSWDGQAAWISGGILYTVDGDASLAPDQLRRMAASM